MAKIGMIQNQGSSWLERLQKIFPELLFLSCSKNIPQIVTANINNISYTDFILSSKEITFRFVGDELRTDIQNIMQVAPLLRWSPKLKYLFASDWETAKSLASFLEQLLSKATIGPSSKILFIRYLEGLFSLQNTLCLERSQCLFFYFS